MRRMSLLAVSLLLFSGQGFARSLYEEKGPKILQYQGANETAEEFKETDLPLHDFPDVNSEGWFDLYINNTYKNQPKILLSSISLAPDKSVRYILNIQSKQGFNNLSSEGLYCSNTSLNFNEKNKRSSYKVYAYGDSVNHHWIPSRVNNDWKPIGAVLNTAEPVHAVLYRAFCEDGLPNNNDALRERIMLRAGRYPTSLSGSGSSR